jgi:multidrug efflux pump subunit AcrA (membrane-fusion protein)
MMRALALAAALLAAASHDAAAQASRIPAVTVAPAAVAPIRETLLVTGSFVAREEVLVTAEIDGLAIVEVLAEEGDRVRAGQVLARLNRETLDVQLAQNAAQIARAEAGVAQTRSQIAEAQANVTQANQSLARARSLAPSGATSQEVLDQRTAAARASEARLQAATQALALAEADKRVAEAQRRDIQLRLARTEVRSRAAGTVSRRAARLGQMVGGAGDPLFRIISDGAIELEAEVPETTLARLKPGQPALVEAAGRDEALTGRVRLVSPEITRQTRLGRVRIALERDDVPIGSFGRGSVEVAKTEGVVVPLSAVLFAASGPTVQVVVDGIVRTRRVTTGLRDQGRIEIRSGVAAGEDVVTVSGTFVRDGDRVAPVRQDRQASAEATR